MRGLSLISSGIDSPVASYVMLKLGVSLDYIHFDNQPFTDGSGVDKTIRLIKALKRHSKKPCRLYIVKHGENQAQIIKTANRRNQCVLCRRIMLRTAERVAAGKRCDCLVTGENLGQVASQTLTNLTTASQSVKIPILRPLLTCDKNETVELAKQIGTFEISSEPGLCCVVVPKRPKTNVLPEDLVQDENSMDINALVDRAIKSMDVIEI
ncbi:MAG: hypothetical protein ABH879_03700 [archaeon]